MDGEMFAISRQLARDCTLHIQGQEHNNEKNEKDQSQDYYCNKLAVLLCSVKRGDYVRY